MSRSQASIPLALIQPRGLLDTLCKSTGTTPGITLIGKYPCNDPSIFSRTAYLAKQLPSTVSSFIAATHPFSGPYPNEVWLLHCCCVLLGWTCLLCIWPRLYLRLRPWMWNVVNLTGALSPCLGLLTHPHAPPGLYWTNHVPVVGLVLHFTQISTTVRQSGRSAIIKWCTNSTHSLRM